MSMVSAAAKQIRAAHRRQRDIAVMSSLPDSVLRDAGFTRDYRGDVVTLPHDMIR